MRRIVWVAVGAAGGIVAYRRAQQALAEAREQGVVLSAQQVGVSAAARSARPGRWPRVLPRPSTPESGRPPRPLPPAPRPGAS